MRESGVAEGELSDEALLAGMAIGEQPAAVTFVRRYQRRVFGLAYSMTGDAGVSEDVAQEAMVRVWRHAPVFDPRRGSVASWVLTITRNLAIDALRLRRAVPTDPDDFAASAMRSNEHNPEDAVRPRRRTPHRAGCARGAAAGTAPRRRPRRRLRENGARDQRVRRASPSAPRRRGSGRPSSASGPRSNTQRG